MLETAIRVAPQDTRDWGEGMRAEMAYMEGHWAAVMWAVGGASVMVKEALAALLVPSLRGRGVVPDGGLFAKDASLRKAALTGGAICALASLLFLATPPFRQGFQVAMQPWYHFIQLATRDYDAPLERLARRAESQHDAEALAFCAMRLSKPGQSARWAQEAVSLDPNLLWIYAVIETRHPNSPEVRPWIPKLEQWDGKNALIPLIKAQSMVRDEFHYNVYAPPSREMDAAWRAQMQAAFDAPKFDDYLDRVAELNRRGIPRYRFYDPYGLVLHQVEIQSWVEDSSERFAKIILNAGDDLESRSDRKGALEKYWQVGRFGELLDSQGRTGFEHRLGTYLQSMAYKRLQALYEKEGDAGQASHFGYLVKKFDPISGENSRFAGEAALGYSTAARNAAVVEISGLMIIVSLGLALAGAAILISAKLRPQRPAAEESKPVATVVVLASTVALLFSAATLYLTYRPYWYMFQSAIQNGGQSQTDDLRLLLLSAETLPGLSPRVYFWLHSLLYSGSPTFLFYFWTGVTLFSVIGLLLILSRHFLGRPPSGGLPHSPRVP